MERRAFLGLGLGSAVFARRSAQWQRAREIVARGDLGRVLFCRMVGGSRVRLVDAMEWVMDATTPLSVNAQGSAGGLRLVVFRYPGFVASWEPGEDSVTFCGAQATLTVRGGCTGREACATEEVS
jgi:hypothetical protein